MSERSGLSVCVRLNGAVQQMCALLLVLEMGQEARCTVRTPLTVQIHNEFSSRRGGSKIRVRHYLIPFEEKHSNILLMRRIVRVCATNLHKKSIARDCIHTQ